MSKVWVVADGHHDYEAAREYGEVKFLFEDPRLWNIPDMDDHLNTVDVREDDYLLLAGPLLANVLATTWWLKRFKELRLLVFNARSEKYVVRRLR